MRIDKRKLLGESLALVCLLAVLTAARSSLADHYYVPSGSMEHAVLPGDRVVVDKTAYGLRLPLLQREIGDRGPERGDVAVFDSPKDGRRLIKRIVAIGGDVVSVRDGLVTVNGRPLDVPVGPFTALERFGDREVRLNLEHGGGPDLPRQRVPEGMALALGDHRGSSFDSRYWGFVEQRELEGKAIAVYYRRGAGLTWQPL